MENKSKDNYDIIMWVGSVLEVWHTLVGLGKSNVGCNNCFILSFLLLPARTSFLAGGLVCRI